MTAQPPDIPSEISPQPVPQRPALEQIGAEFPGWYAWPGIGGIVYARRLRSSPPIILRAHNPVALRDRVSKKDAELRSRR